MRSIDGSENGKGAASSKGRAANLTRTKSLIGEKGDHKKIGIKQLLLLYPVLKVSS